MIIPKTVPHGVPTAHGMKRYPKKNCWISSKAGTMNLWDLLRYYHPILTMALIEELHQVYRTTNEVDFTEYESSRDFCQRKSGFDGWCCTFYPCQFSLTIKIQPEGTCNGTISRSRSGCWNWRTSYCFLTSSDTSWIILRTHTSLHPSLHILPSSPPPNFWLI